MRRASPFLKAVLPKSPNAPARASEPGMSSLFTDLQDQLGLKLEAAKVQMEVLVIDSVQRLRRTDASQ